MAHTQTDSPEDDDVTDIWEAEEPPRIRFLRRLVTVMGLVLIFGFILVVTAIIVKLMGVGDGRQAAESGQPAPAPQAIGDFIGVDAAAIPAEAEVLSAQAVNGALLVLTRGPDGAVLIEIDPATGAEQGRMRFTPSAATE